MREVSGLTRGQTDIDERRIQRGAQNDHQKDEQPKYIVDDVLQDVFYFVRHCVPAHFVSPIL